MRKLTQVVALTLTLSAVPGLSGAQTMPAAMTGGSEPTVTLAAFPTTLREVQNIPTDQAVAIVGFGAIGGYLVETFLSGGLLTLGGVAVGALVGNTWYERHYWPF